MTRCNGDGADRVAFPLIFPSRRPLFFPLLVPLGVPHGRLLQLFLKRGRGVLDRHVHAFYALARVVGLARRRLILRRRRGHRRHGHPLVREKVQLQRGVGHARGLHRVALRHRKLLLICARAPGAQLVA